MHLRGLVPSPFSLLHLFQHKGSVYKNHLTHVRRQSGAAMRVHKIDVPRHQLTSLKWFCQALSLMGCPAPAPIAFYFVSVLSDRLLPAQFRFFLWRRAALGSSHRNSEQARSLVMVEGQPGPISAHKEMCIFQKWMWIFWLTVYGSWIAQLWNLTHPSCQPQMVSTLHRIPWAISLPSPVRRPGSCP